VAKTVTAAAFVQKAVELAKLHPPIPYVLGGRARAGTDCSNLIRLILKELGASDIQAGSNAMWASHVTNKAFIHAGGNFRGGGHLAQGVLLFMDYGTPANQTATGTPGKMDHMGIYVGPVSGLVTPDGKQADVIHASASRGIVCGSTLKNAWTHVAHLKGMIFDEGGTLGLVDMGPANPAGSLPNNPAPPKALGQGQARVITTTSGLYLREGPHTKYRRIKEMPIGAIVEVVHIQDGWANVRWDVRPGLYHTGWCCVGENGVQYLELG